MTLPKHGQMVYLLDPRVPLGTFVRVHHPQPGKKHPECPGCVCERDLSTDGWWVIDSPSNGSLLGSMLTLVDPATVAFVNRDDGPC